ncbi:hypothetical protein DRN75_01155 [Nanoarchaeota archaeon]|nr:MAG: hypothetical protein DRN75_01155 [Nanoarchaeota archaeon]
MFVMVVGMSASGKNAVISRAMSRLEGFTHIVYGDYVVKYAKKLGISGDRDELKRVADLKTFKKIQQRAALSIKFRSLGKNVILNTHAVVYKDGNILPGIPYSILRILKPDMIIVIDANERDIMLRRKRDKTRNRDKDNMETLSVIREATLCAARTMSLLSGAPLRIIKNREGQIDTAVKEFLDAINIATNLNNKRL